jgi:hypothetical protein
VAQTAQDGYDRATAAAAVTLTDEHADRIHALASDFLALWSEPRDSAAGTQGG